MKGRVNAGRHNEREMTLGLNNDIRCHVWPYFF